MLQFHELHQNPASVTFCDETEAKVTVIAERFRQGLVNMTCQCRHHSEAGWCKHCLAVLCDRIILDDDGQQSLAFESIVAGTRLKATANELKEVLEAFATAYRNLKRELPTALDPDQLHNFGTKAYQASIAAHQVALGIDAFIKELRPRRMQNDGLDQSRRFGHILELLTAGGMDLKKGIAPQFENSAV